MNYSTVKVEPIADLQTAFDTAYRGLKAQGFRRSYDRSAYRCMYRGPNETKCAVGHLIPDNIYIGQGQMNYAKISQLVQMSPEIAVLFANLKQDDLVALQVKHDNASNPEDMETRLHEFALDYNLTIPGQ